MVVGSVEAQAELVGYPVSAAPRPPLFGSVPRGLLNLRAAPMQSDLWKHVPAQLELISVGVG